MEIVDTERIERKVMKNRIINEMLTKIEEEKKKFNKNAISRIEKIMLDVFGAGYEDSFVKYIIDEEELFIIYEIKGYDNLFFKVDFPNRYATQVEVLLTFLYKESKESYEFGRVSSGDCQVLYNVRLFCKAFDSFLEEWSLKKEQKKEIEKEEKPLSFWQKIKAIKIGR